MSDAAFKIKVINVVIGSLGDISSKHATAMKMAVQLREVIRAIDEQGNEKDVDDQLKKMKVTNLEQTYENFIKVACHMIDRTRDDIEKEAKDDQFGNLEID